MRFIAKMMVISALAWSAAAQNPPAPTAPAAAAPARGGRGGVALRSPEVASDGRVTFRLRAPNAKEVLVTGLGQPLAMQKNEQGVWTATTDPLKPDIYTYAFSVDSATFNDPSNSQFKTSYGSAGQSLFHVPGAVSWEPAAGVPRGAVTRRFYHSAVAGDDRDYWVYTPAGYDAKRKEPFPVLYLLHGLGDEAGSWITIGAANVILDNLIAQGKARPMIMVNPLGYGNAGGPANAMTENMLANYTRTVLEEIMPQVERAYNVAKDRTQRAIAGLSMGGAEATFTGLNHLDKFAYIGSFSGAYVMWPGAMAGRGPAAAPAPAAPGTPAPDAAGRGGRGGRGMQSLDAAVIDKNFPILDAKANAQIRLLWIACGTADGLVGVTRQFRDWLNSRKVKFAYVEIPEVGHVWPLWRQNLTDLAPLLFQTKGK